MEILRYLNGKEINKNDLKGLSLSSEAMVSAIASARRRAEKNDIKKESNKSKISE